jgi:hypothetical protein
MPIDVSPSKVQEFIHTGFKRLEVFKSSRLHFLRQYTGQYYGKSDGEVGAEALGLIYNAIKVLLPNIVMNYPRHHVDSRFLAGRDYAELLGLALEIQDKDLDIRTVYRRVIVDALFTLGITKTGLTTSDDAFIFDDEVVDPGKIYTEVVDFDNFVVDPRSQDHLFTDAAWMGDKMVVSRGKLLESGLYKEELVKRLPDLRHSKKTGQASNLSQRNLKDGALYELEDEVEIVEVWVPEANAVLTVPGSTNTKFDDYLRVEDYYGPSCGPYSFLALSPPVPGNPLPVSQVGMWYDLHVMANRMAAKVIDQAERQKDVYTYRRGAGADDAQEIQDAADGEGVAVDDPDNVKVISLGGQRQSNEVMVSQLQNWFNMMASNPQGIGGQQLDSDSATEAQILQTNANIGLEDMKDQVYIFAGQEARKRAWFLHTDPFINLPLIRRATAPAQYAFTPQGPLLVEPEKTVEQQVLLTPEARRGDWLDFNFEIRTDSMGRKDHAARLRIGFDFATKIMPAAMSLAQTAALLGQPFNVKVFIIRMAKDAGMDWLDEVFYDPDFQVKMMQMMMQGPDAAMSKGQPSGQEGEGARLQPALQKGLKEILQNGQPGSVMKGQPDAQLEQRQGAQAGANESQAQLKGGY